jgi:hypothetical protein
MRPGGAGPYALARERGLSNGAVYRWVQGNPSAGDVIAIGPDAARHWLVAASHGACEVSRDEHRSPFAARH